jgi:pimeloyl-ACP methyl ester carboxylesterase
VQLAAHSLADDVATVKRAIDLVGGPTILVGHSFGGFVIMNAGYNNQNVTGLVYVSAFAPDESESAATFVDVATLPTIYYLLLPKLLAKEKWRLKCVKHIAIYTNMEQLWII